jgi:hypothetical protein
VLQLSATAAVTLSMLAATQSFALASGRHDQTTPQILASGNTVSTVAPAVKVPGSLAGLGFDTCTAPDQATMDELRTQSPYWGVGVYIGGENRSCAQPELTRDWVTTQHHKGWHIFPLWVGLQAPILGRGTSHERRCIDGTRLRTPMSTDNATARRQGVSAATRAIAHAKDLGMAKGSTLFLDMESYANTISACNQPVLNFQSGWSKRLHRLGWKSGYYSSAGTGILALDFARATFPGTYEMPDAIWFARGDGVATVDGDPYVRDSFWRNQRIHQYELDVTKTFGDATVHVDQDAIVIGRGSVPGRPRHTCGVDLDFGAYRSWSRGDHSAQIMAAQCLLKLHGLFSRPLSGQFNLATARGVGAFQDRRGLAVTRTLTPRTWTALLSAGSTPLVKRGSAGDRVRFLQRSLTAALRHPVTIDGVFGRGTTTAVRRYQRAAALPATGVVTRTTWHSLQLGHR